MVGLDWEFRFWLVLLGSTDSSGKHIWTGVETTIIVWSEDTANTKADVASHEAEAE